MDLCAISDIAEGEEITAHYGEQYIRSYEGLGKYTAEAENETPESIADGLHLSVSALVGVNKQRHPTITSKSKLWAGTELPVEL